MSSARDALTSDPARPLVTMLGHTTVVLVLLTTGYYLVPLGGQRGEPAWLFRLAAALLLLLAVAALTRHYLFRSLRRQSRQYVQIELLLTALYLLVLCFALAYAVIAQAGPEQFAGISNRSDALYFSVTVVSTVGLGDVHPVETASRLLVTCHMLFNVIYLGTALRLLSSGISPAG